MSAAFQLFVTVEAMSTRMDNQVVVKLSTQELKPEDAATLFGLRGKQCFCAFLETEINLSDIQPPKEEPEFKDQKSPSARLRNVLFVWWTQQGKPLGNFETWRAGKMEEFIENIKAELEP